MKSLIDIDIVNDDFCIGQTPK